MSISGRRLLPGSSADATQPLPAWRLPSPLRGGSVGGVSLQCSG